MSPLMDIYAFDTVSVTTVLVSRSADGLSGGNATSRNPSIDAVGNVIAFESWATNPDLRGIDSDDDMDVYVRNLAGGATQLASSAIDGNTSGNGASLRPVVSDDGQYVVFESEASNLDTSGLDTDALSDVYRFDVSAGVNIVVSTSTGGTASGNGKSDAASISLSGSKVAFRSESSNILDGSLAPHSWLNGQAIYLKDLTTDDTSVASLAEPAGLTLAEVTHESESDDQRYVAFSTRSPLVAEDTNLVEDVYVRDRLYGTVRLVSRDAHMHSGDGASLFPVISGDGSTIVFQSYASNLDSSGADTDAVADIYRYDLQTETLKLVTTINDPNPQVLRSGHRTRKLDLAERQHPKHMA